METRPEASKLTPENRKNTKNKNTTNSALMVENQTDS